MWLVKVAGKNGGKSVLTTDNVDHVVAEVASYLKGGASKVEIERIDLWAAPE